MSGTKSSNNILLVLILLTVFALGSGHGQRGPCTTLQKNPGICVPILTCRTITQLFDNSPRPLPTWVSDQVRQSYCGTFNNTPHVCCEQTHKTSEPLTSAEGGPCTTLQKEPGICVPIRTCRTITQLLDNSPRPLPTWVSDQVRQLHCGTFNHTYHTCCDPSKVTVTPSVSTPKSIIRAGIKEKPEGELEAEMAMLQQNVCGINDMHLFGDSSAFCAYNRSSNSDHAEISEYPWMALLVYFDGVSRTLDCGGSLITERYVLTAAHCLHVQTKRLVSVRLGEHDNEKDEDCIYNSCDEELCVPTVVDIDIEEAISHPNYNPRTFSDDIGIIRLTKNAVISSNIIPICLPITQKRKAVDSENMTISGWGRMENGVKDNILQKAYVPIRSIEYCEKELFTIMTDKQLCAGGGYTEMDACKGDTGGPLFDFYKEAERFIQYGIVSGDKCSKKPQIITKVEAYLNWIASNLKSSTKNVTSSRINQTGERPSSEPLTSVEGGPCITLKKEPGICVPIKICRTITHLFDISPRPLPAWVSDQVRQSHCGTFNNTHHACCDPKNVTETPPPPVSTPKPNIRTGIVEKSEGELQAEIAMLQKTVCGINSVNFFRQDNEDGTECLSNGVDVEMSEYPFMALLVYFDGVSRTLDCGGSLIHKRYVLTAAHCIRVQTKKLVSVRLGEHNTETDPDCIHNICTKAERCAPPVHEIDIEESIYHQDYNPRTFSDDVGIIRLKTNAVIGSNVKPICLPVTSDAKNYSSRHNIISGWGRIENGNKATILQKANVGIRTNNCCQLVHKLVRINPKHLCAGGENNIDTCKGDSGGPLISLAPYKGEWRYVQYGIISAGSMFCGSQNSPGIYARVESYLLWIVSNLNLSTG